MASKRQRGSTSTSSSYDRRKFCSKKAEELFHKSVVHRSLIQERGIAVREHMINQRGWAEFVKQPEAAVVSIVREFYANAAFHKDYMVLVRGKYVSFSAQAINEHYQLPEVENDDYSNYVEAGPDLDEIVHTIAAPGTTWRLSIRGEPLNFRSGALIRQDKALFLFIIAKLLPSSHTTEITRERAILMHSILREDSLNVGKLIQGSIENFAKHKPVGGLGHPSLITALCAKAGVVWDPNEELQHPKSLITWTIMERRMQNPMAEAEEVAQRQGQEDPNANLPIRQRMQNLEQSLNEFKLDIYRRLDEQKDDLFNLGQCMQFQIQHSEALQKKWEEQFGTSNVHFPKPPDFSKGQGSSSRPRQDEPDT